MATIFNAGFLTGDLSEAFSTSGTLSVQSSVVRLGAYALRVNPTTTGAGVAVFTSIASNGSFNGSSVGTNFIRVYFRYATKPAAGSEEILVVNDSLGATKFTVRLNSSGQLEAYGSGATTLLATGSTVLAANTWYMLRVKVGTGATAAWDVQIGITSEISGTSSTGTTNAANVRLGKATDRNGNSVDFFYADLIWSSTAFVGEGKAIRLVPRAAGSASAWTATGAATDWQATKEFPTDSDTTYISSVINGDSDIMALTPTGIHALSVINTVRVMVMVARPVTNGSVIVRCGSQGAFSNTSAATTTSATYTQLSKIADQDPFITGAWTTSSVNAMEAGIQSNSVNEDRCSSVWVFADVTEPPPVATVFLLVA